LWPSERFSPHLHSLHGPISVPALARIETRLNFTALRKGAAEDDNRTADALLLSRQSSPPEFSSSSPDSGGDLSIPVILSRHRITTALQTSPNGSHAASLGKSGTTFEAWSSRS